MICNSLLPSEAVCVCLIADDRKHRRKMFPFRSEAIADKRTTNPLRNEEKKARTCFKSDWRYFKANNSVSPIGHRLSQTHVSIKNCLSRKRRNGRESRTGFNFHPDRLPQLAADAGDRCFHMSATWRRSVSQTDRRRLQIIWKPGLTRPTSLLSYFLLVNLSFFSGV